jgi:hypothetical protein
MRIVFVAVFSMSLAGCAASPVSLPSGKSVPGWAMNVQADESFSAERPAVRQRRSASLQRASARNTATAQSDATPTNSVAASTKPFSPEWREREDALDGQLRRTMNICNGC